MSEDRINAMKEFVAFLKRKKGMDVSGDLYIDNVNFLFSEIAALRAKLAETEKEVERLRKRSVCVYCGKITEHEGDKLTEIIEHMAVCEKHPVPILLERAVNAENLLISKNEEIEKLKNTIVFNKPYEEVLCLLRWKERAEKAEAANADLRERLKLVKEVWVSWGYLDDYITKNVLTTKFAKEMWQAIKAACENVKRGEAPVQTECNDELGGIEHIEHTERGFEIISFEDRYGVKCSLQQSSLAEYEKPGISAVWLGCDDANPRIFVPGKSWQPVPMPAGYIADTRMHLDRKQVAALIVHLQNWLDNDTFISAT